MKPAASSMFEAIQTQVMWNRLISVVEEQAQALLRTAFGSVAARPVTCRLACMTPRAACWRRR